MAETKTKHSKYPPPVSLRLTFEERTRLEQDAIGMSLSAYIRSRLFDNKTSPRRKRQKVRIKDHKILAQLLGLLGQSRIASNLNQLAKASNKGALPVTTDIEKEIKEACAYVKHIREMLIEALGLQPEGRQ